MVKALVGLRSLLALLLMPLGMDAALAAGERSVSAMAAHCVDHDDHDDGNQEAPAKPERHCATCIALTGAAAHASQPVPFVRMRLATWEQASSPGLKGKVITPPPRLG